MRQDAMNHMPRVTFGLYSLGGLLAAIALAAAGLGCACDKCGTCSSCRGGLFGQHATDDSCQMNGVCRSCGRNTCSCDLFALGPLFQMPRTWGGSCGCEACCQSSSGCGRYTMRDVNRHFSCGYGCGDMYWGEPAQPRCDSCDCEGNFIGQNCRGPFAAMHDCWSWFTGYGCGRCCPCGCDGDCNYGNPGDGYGDCATCGHPIMGSQNMGSQNMDGQQMAPQNNRSQDMPPPPPAPEPEMRGASRSGGSRNMRAAPATVHVTQPGRSATMRTISQTKGSEFVVEDEEPAPQPRPPAMRTASRSSSQTYAGAPKSGNRVVRFQANVKDAQAPVTYEIELKDGETLVDSPTVR